MMIERSHALPTTRQALELGISMDGRGAWCDNVFVERLWRRMKYEKVY